jgi:hypothetical protein
MVGPHPHDACGSRIVSHARNNFMRHIFPCSESISEMHIDKMSCLYRESEVS